MNDDQLTFIGDKLWHLTDAITDLTSEIGFKSVQEKNDVSEDVNGAFIRICEATEILEEINISELDIVEQTNFYSGIRKIGDASEMLEKALHDLGIEKP